MTAKVPTQYLQECLQVSPDPLIVKWSLEHGSKCHKSLSICCIDMYDPIEHGSKVNLATNSEDHLKM